MSQDTIWELTILDPKKVTFWVDEFEDLRIKLEDGTEYAKVRAMRAFPLSAQERYIVLRDEEGKELAMIKDPGELDAKSRRALEVELEKSYFVPQITSINKIDEDFGVPKWDVETDRGHRRFELGTRNDAKMVGRGRVLIKDIDGNRYEISNYHGMDAKSISYVESEV